MGFFKAVGRAFSSGTQALKYQFTVDVHSATNFFDDVRSGGQLYLEWKRGEKHLTSAPGQITMQDGLTACVWNERLSLVSTIFKTSTGYEGKEAKFTVFLNQDGRSRPLGVVYWNLPDFVSAAPGENRESVCMLLRAEGHKRAKKFIRGGLAEPSWDGIQLRVTITTQWLQDYRRGGANDDAQSAYSDRTGVTQTTADSAAGEDAPELGSPRTLPTRSTLPLSSAAPPPVPGPSSTAGLAQRAEAIAARATQASDRLRQWDAAARPVPAAAPLAPDASRDQLVQRVQILEQANRQLRGDAEELVAQLKHQQKTAAWLQSERERLLKALEEAGGPTPLRATKDANAWLERDRERLIREVQSLQERHERALREASAKARDESRAVLEQQLRQQMEQLQDQTRSQWRGDAAALAEENAELKRRLEDALSRDKRASYSGEFVCTRCHADSSRLRSSGSGEKKEGSSSLKSSIKGFLGGGSGYGRREREAVELVDESYVRSLQTDLIEAKMRLAYGASEVEEVKCENMRLRRQGLLMEQEIYKAKRILEQRGIAPDTESNLMTLPGLDGFAECLPSFGSGPSRGDDH